MLKLKKTKCWLHLQRAVRAGTYEPIFRKGTESALYAKADGLNAQTPCSFDLQAF